MARSAAAPAMTQYQNGEVRVPIELLPLVPGFLARRDDDIVHLHDFIKSRNFQAIAGLAHRLQGVGSSYGFHAISQIAAEMGAVAKAADEQRMSELIKNLSEVVEELKQKDF